MAKKKVKKFVNEGISDLPAEYVYIELKRAQDIISELKEKHGNDPEVLNKVPRYVLWTTYRNQLESFLSIPF